MTVKTFQLVSQLFTVTTRWLKFKIEVKSIIRINKLMEYMFTINSLIKNVFNVNIIKIFKSLIGF